MGGQVSESVRDLYVGTAWKALPASVFPKFGLPLPLHIHPCASHSPKMDRLFVRAAHRIPLSLMSLGRK